MISRFFLCYDCIQFFFWTSLLYFMDWNVIIIWSRKDLKLLKLAKWEGKPSFFFKKKVFVLQCSGVKLNVECHSLDPHPYPVKSPVFRWLSVLSLYPSVQQRFNKCEYVKIFGLFLRGCTCTNNWDQTLLLFEGKFRGTN